MNKEKHQEILKMFFEKYKPSEIDKNEFTWDGPSDWDSWENQKPKILFLVKEARDGFQPSDPGQIIMNKFARNIARWKFAVKSLYENQDAIISFPTRDQIVGTNDDVTFVEVKKINEENISSSYEVINQYARDDRKLLKEQIDIIRPNVIFCCYTITPYNIIYESDNEPHLELIKYNGCSCLKHKERLVINFYHPSTPPAYIQTDSKRDKELFKILCTMIKDGKVFDKFDWR